MYAMDPHSNTTGGDSLCLQETCHLALYPSFPSLPCPVSLSYGAENQTYGLLHSR